MVGDLIGNQPTSPPHVSDAIFVDNPAFIYNIATYNHTSLIQ